ncbi:sulfatase [Rhodobaculum claviforme]|uniref:Sulfatase n=1 Tax=Rhodobaculum claviforme TaxID=1549854 RepID=A0A934TML3_9RHOB|nr:sulfatase [Rhodobaculum claviforme]MBK5928894.1 sulfatase [Rhodobaculum claviforme]
MTGRRAALGAWGRAALAAGVLWLVLIQPNHPAAMTWGAFAMFPLELPVIVLGMIALPGRGWLSRIVRAALVATLLVLVVAKLADFATFVAFNRAFNILVDAPLIAAAWNLGSGSIGVAAAGMSVVAAGLALLGLAVALWWALGVWVGMVSGPGLRRAAVVALVPAAVLAVAEGGQAMRAWALPFDPPGAAFTARVGVERAIFYTAALRDLEEFRRRAAEDPFAGSSAGSSAGLGGLLDRIGDTDVLIVYVESYGRSSFLNPLYAGTHPVTLARIESRLAERGLAMRSAFLTAPMVGGQSWLSHGTIATGLWIDNQRRNAAMLASPRRTLFHFARDAGFDTAAVMPAITMDWPEAAFFGFDTILAADDLGYRGEAFNWVTMPDQFTLLAMDRALRQGRPGVDRAPLFAQVALISSHAPWTPVPELLDWDAIGDGTEFNAMARAGDPPEVVWRDHDRVREQFRRAVDYTLQVIGSYAERHAAAPPLMVVIGDHEPAPFVSQVAGFDVPVHLIGPPDLVERAAQWGWQPGLVPGPDAPVWRMDAFRDRFLEAFSTGPRSDPPGAGIEEAALRPAFPWERLP